MKTLSKKQTMKGRLYKSTWWQENWHTIYVSSKFVEVVGWIVVVAFVVTHW